MAALSTLQPTYLQGPCCIEFNGGFHFATGGVTVDPGIETSDTPSDFAGNLGKSLKAAKWTISFTPVGELKNFSYLFAYGASALGKRIFNPASAANKPLKIHTWEDQQSISFPRAAVGKSPSLVFSPNKTVFGSAVEFHALGDNTVQPTVAGFWRAITGSDTFPSQFQAELVTKERAHAALGSRSAPYNAMTALQGFTFDTNYQFKWLEDDETGYADCVLESILPTTTFIPANLTQAQMDTLAAMEGSSAVRIGKMIGVIGEHLVVASENLTLTHKAVGVIKYGETYQTGTHRLREMTYTSRVTTTTKGTIDDLFTIALNS
jgi:hypothetical protein